jgi:hypothetical protein
MSEKNCLDCEFFDVTKELKPNCDLGLNIVDNYWCGMSECCDSFDHAFGSPPKHTPTRKPLNEKT